MKNGRKTEVPRLETVASKTCRANYPKIEVGDRRKVPIRCLCAAVWAAPAGEFVAFIMYMVQATNVWHLSHALPFGQDLDGQRPGPLRFVNAQIQRWTWSAFLPDANKSELKFQETTVVFPLKVRATAKYTARYVSEFIEPQQRWRSSRKVESLGKFTILLHTLARVVPSKFRTLSLESYDSP